MSEAANFKRVFRAQSRRPIVALLAWASIALLPAAFANDPAVSVNSVAWRTVAVAETAALNADLDAGQPTADVGIYYPANLDPVFREAVPVQALLEEFAVAKQVMLAAGVQLRLLWVRSGEIAPQWLSLQADDRDSKVPNDGYANLYVHGERHPTSLSSQALQAFEAIVEPSPDNDRTVYLVVLQSVYMSYFDTEDEGRNWAQHLVRTEGLSFPGYLYGDRMPRRLRGVITLSGTRDNHWKRTAHELGHKLMNVSHEYMDQSPQHEVRAEGGLMFYGNGVDIPSGEQGRWHRERLHLSPFIYRIDASGQRVWNHDYREHGFYYDSLYGDNAIHFNGTRRTQPFVPGETRIPE